MTSMKFAPEEAEEELTDGRSENMTEWIVDSGCSYHMCPNRDYFSTYKSVEGGVAIMGNNSECKILGIGTIRIRMYDGVVRTLTKVRHVPGLQRNLVSLGVLDSQGCKIISESGAMKIFRGNLVVMKARNVRNLYVLEGSAVSPPAGASSSMSPPDSSTRLGQSLQKIELVPKGLYD